MRCKTGIQDFAREETKAGIKVVALGPVDSLEARLLTDRCTCSISDMCGFSGRSLDIATSNGPHLARWTRPASRPRPISRLCCSQACLSIFLSVEMFFLDTGEGIWFCAQMWLATLEGSTLFGNGRTANPFQAVMSR